MKQAIKKVFIKAKDKLQKHVHQNDTEILLMKIEEFEDNYLENIEKMENIYVESAYRNECTEQEVFEAMGASFLNNALCTDLITN